MTILSFHGYPKMKVLIERVASRQEEAQRFVGEVFANPAQPLSTEGTPW
jgi:hypothetical protein